MIPLNIYLQEAFDTGLDDPRARQQMEHSVIEYGNAIKDLVAANIFPGDMLWKNFGVTTMTKSNTSPTAISARCPSHATKKKR